MGIGSKFRQAFRSFEDESRRMAKYTFAAGGAMIAGPQGAAAGYQIGSSLDDRKPKLQQSGTDLAKLRREAQANGFNPLTVLRATGGQGFYHQQIPMGRLSSDTFFNAFDAYQQRNPPAPEIKENTITGKEILAPVTMSNGKLNSDQNTAIYDVIQDPVTLEYVNDGEKVFSAIQKPADFVEVDHRGNKWRFPWEDVEWDAILIGSYKKVLQEAYYQGDTIGKSLRAKMGKMFGIYGYKADKKTIGNTINQLEKLQKQMQIKNQPLSSAQFDNKLGIKKPIKGLTTRVRERQDRINQQMGW